MHLVVRGGVLRTPEGASYELGIAPLVIGRDPGCDVVLDDDQVSAQHARLAAESHGARLVDLGSRNGTVVSGMQIKDALLTSTCTIQVGKTPLVFAPSARARVDVGDLEEFGPLVGRSPRMRHVFRVLGEVAPTNLSVLVLGETGTGKELVAQAIREHSSVAKGPFVVVDCATIPSPLAESILFGHEKGSFTGATERRAGAFHEADGGTLFLDELGELPNDLQPKLLRALAEQTVKRVGSHSYDRVQVRVVCATRKDLSGAINAGRFRSDLFFRVAQIRIELPPLRDRRDDIPTLIGALCTRMGKPERAEDIMELVETRLGQHEWRGNVRELANFVAVAASLPLGSETVVASLSDLGGSDLGLVTSEFVRAKADALTEFERKFFTDLARACEGNVSEMARRSGLARHHVRNYLKKHGLA